ncbi:polynucleotidyl transferase [Striga asiatica]|uniref:Polynucleotidyl transferase n=1 Tax=Striga asiatica TaxID=4170 RepID=A0A5A7QEU7_STRAF|nr:polynucleotidyl transferase [Striga asiatica]
MFLWLVWEDRNLFLNGGRLSDIDVMIDKGFRLVKNYDKAQASLKGRKGNENGCYLQFNAVVRDSEIGLGVWIKYSEGLVVAIFESNMSGSFSPTLAEVLSIQFGLQFTSMIGVKIQQVTTNFFEVVQRLIANDSHHPFKGIFSNILAPLDSLDCGLNIPNRLHNEIARTIAISGRWDK